MLTKTKKIRASSAAFMKGRLVFTDYATGCLRNILFNSWGIKEQLKQGTQDRGAMNEDRYIADNLVDTDLDVSREITSPVTQVTDTVAWGGRTDVHVKPRSAGPAEIYELKSTGSKNKLRDLKQGKYTTENLAQLVAYMTDWELSNGHLVYSYYEPDAFGKDQLKYEKDFTVKLDTAGTVVVDNEPTMFSVADQLHHRLQAAEVVDKDIVWDRPHNYDAAFGSPCHWCPFKSACARWDSGVIESVDNLLLEANMLVRSKE